MTSSETQAAAADQPGAIVPRPVHGDVIDAYEGMIASVPDAGGDGIEAILAQLARAESPDQLDSPWQAGGLADYRDRPILVTGIRKAPSEHPGPLPYFLIIDGQDPATGELLTITTGAVSVVAQLVKAYTAGWLPVMVIPRMAERATKDGFYPWHLDVHR